MANNQKQPKNEDVSNAPSEDQKQSKNEDVSEEETKLNASKIMPDPLGSLKADAPEDEANNLVDKLSDAELDERRPLCEVSLRKGLRKLANYRVTRLDGTIEMCCIEEVGPGNQYLKAVPL